MKGHYNLLRRPNLFFNGDNAVIEWFLNQMVKATGPQALLIRDNGTPQIVASSKLKAVDFIATVGIYTAKATVTEIGEDVAHFWIRNLNELKRYRR